MKQTLVKSMHFSALALVGYQTPEKCAVVVNDGLKAGGALAEFDYIIPMAFSVIRSREISIIIVVYFYPDSKCYPNC